MSTSRSQTMAVVFGLASAVLLVVAGGLAWNYFSIRSLVTMASEQTLIFEEMRARALRSSEAEAAGCLRYLARYESLGGAQETASRLDQMVERERAAAVRDILAYLRAKTGQDLGANPEAWIKRYAEKSETVPTREEK